MCADLADYAEREAGSEPQRASLEAEAGPSGAANGATANVTAGSSELPNGYTPQPSTSTEELMDQWLEQLRERHRCETPEIGSKIQLCKVFAVYIFISQLSQLYCLGLILCWGQS